jgi:hypothetical protein
VEIKSGMNGQMDMGKTCMPSDREIKIIFSIAAYVAIEMPKSHSVKAMYDISALSENIKLISTSFINR